MRGAALLLLVGGAWAGADVPPGRDRSGEAAEGRVFGSWREVVRVEAGRRYTETTDLEAYRFRPREAETWLYAGELTPRPIADEVRIDPSTDPMRLDLIGIDEGGRRYVKRGIARFEGRRLVWVTSEWSLADRPEARPREFRSTRENGYHLHVLERCGYLDQVGSP